MKSVMLGMVMVLALRVVAEAGTIKVTSTIQAAVDAAQPGDTINVPPGVYQENVRVSTSNLTIRGSNAAVLNGAGLSGKSGIRVASATAGTRLAGFRLVGMTIRNYSRNGVFLSEVDGFEISGGNYEDNAFYAIFPVQSSAGVIEQNDVSGSQDSGIYVGQSVDVVVGKNHVHDCRVGIEIENSSRIDIDHNTATDNAIGLLVFVVPGLDVTETSDINVNHNLLQRNNRPVGPSEEEIPSGVGMLNVGADRVVATGNIAIDNNSAGLAVIALPPALAELDPRIDPFPDDNLIEGNVALRNGASPDALVAPLPGADLLWDGSGFDNHWLDNVFQTEFPSPLP